MADEGGNVPQFVRIAFLRGFAEIEDDVPAPNRLLGGVRSGAYAVGEDAKSNGVIDVAPGNKPERRLPKLVGERHGGVWRILNMRASVASVEMALLLRRGSGVAKQSGERMLSTDADTA